jgi:hypothetical protein
MTVHRVWLRAAAGVAISVVGVGPVAAQVATYPAYGGTVPNPGYTAPTVTYPTPPPTGIVRTAPAAAQPVSAQWGYPTAQPVYAPYRPQAAIRVASNPYPTTGMASDTYSYPVVAQQPEAPAPTASEPMPPPAVEPQASVVNDATSAPPAESYQELPAGYPNGTPSYPSTNYYGAAAGGYGCSGTGGYGLDQYSDDSCDATQWFGGVYFLFMERDNPSYTRFTTAFDMDAVTYPYHPQADTTILSSDDVDYEYQEGIEVRLGSTFTVGDSCGQGGCPSNMFAWEAVWWGLADAEQGATVVDYIPTDDVRFYGMVNYAGLEFDDGTGMRPVNDYVGCQLPVNDDRPPVDGDVRVLAQRVRTDFKAQNLELNFLRFPICDVGGGGCEPACGGPAFTVSGLFGFRYFRTDDNLELATEFGTYSGGTINQVYNGFDYNSSNELFHLIDVENQLVGFQLGGNMNYSVACKWNLFCDTSFGVYNNHVSQYQTIYSGDPTYAQFAETGEDASVDSSKDDVAFLGEVRLGGSYDISSNWRAVLAYRAVGISGVALSNEQIRPEYTNWTDVARIDSDGSIIIHGVQAGLECKY